MPTRKTGRPANPADDRRPQLVRLLSYALRHAPAEFGIQLDTKGWTTLESLVNSAKKRPAWADLSANEVLAVVVNQHDRFEIDRGLIRALYGHSVRHVVSGELASPPSLLFHATKASLLTTIRREGIAARTRRYAHLTSSLDYALRIKEEHEANGAAGIILGVNTQKLLGIPFYRASEVVWTSPYIPPDCLTLIVPVGERSSSEYRELSFDETALLPSTLAESLLTFLNDDGE